MLLIHVQAFVLTISDEVFVDIVAALHRWLRGYSSVQTARPSGRDGPSPVSGTVRRTPGTTTERVRHQLTPLTVSQPSPLKYVVFIYCTIPSQKAYQAISIKWSFL